MKQLFIILFTICMTIYLTFLLSHNYALNYTLYNFTIVQAFTPIFQIFIVLGVAYYVNVKLSNSRKRHEVFIELLDEYKDIMVNINSKALKYIESQDIEKATKIKKELKEANIKLTTIINLKIEYLPVSSYSHKEMRNDYQTYKLNLTNDPFGSTATKYTEVQRQRVIKAHQLIVHKITKEKIFLFKD